MMNQIYPIILCAFALCQVQGNESIKNQTRLIGGTVVGTDTLLSNVAIFSLLYPNNAICSGAIIHAQWIVTAASCVKPYHPVELRYRRSENADGSIPLPNLPQGETHYDKGAHIFKIVAHPSYSVTTRANDIALINTIDAILGAQPYSITRVNPNVINTAVTLRGFGPITAITATTNALSEAFATLTTIATCRNYDRVVPTNKLCTLRGYVCWGDQGGALVSRGNANELIGIISVSPGIDDICGAVPIVTYTNIFLYRTWITKTTQIQDL